MNRAGPIVAAGMLLAFHTAASARGVTPYLPLNLEPEIEAQIERVLILADKPVMRRPIAAATVLDALPKACEVDQSRASGSAAISPGTPTPPILRTPA